MSVIVAIKEKGKIYVGCDSQVTQGSTRSTLKNKNNYKIWQVNNADHCIMGHVGLVRDANVVRLMENLIDDYAVCKKEINYRYVVKYVVPQIIEELKKFNYIKQDEGYFDSMESSYLLAYEDQLFKISPNGTVIEVDDCVAIGSGQDQAIGSLLSTEGQDPEMRIVKAIKASAACDIYVDYPIILGNTQSDKFKVIQEDDDKAMNDLQLNKKEK